MTSEYTDIKKKKTKKKEYDVKYLESFYLLKQLLCYSSCNRIRTKPVYKHWDLST